MKRRAHCDLISPAFLILLLVVLVSYTWPGTSAQGAAEGQREFDYLEGSPKGPSHWGDLKEEWQACKTGTAQSPVAISSGAVILIRNSSVFETRYVPGNAVIRNRGHDISVWWELGKAGSISINGTSYQLQQCHWHSPSEHSIDGSRLDLELHMVHISPSNEFVVVSNLYQSGDPNSFVSQISGHVRSLIDKKEERPIGVLDPRHIMKDGKNYYQYTGSLSTPPCSEGVTWIINEKLMTVSRDQVDLLRQAVFDYAKENARPLQPLNGRQIYLHTPTNE